MTSGILRDEPVPGQPLSALDVFARQVAKTAASVARVVAANPPGRPVPIFRLDSMHTLTHAAGTVALYGMPALETLQTALLEVIVPSATYARIGMADELGDLAAIDLSAGSYLPLTLTGTRVALGHLITISATVTGGSGTVLLRERSGFG